MSALPRPAPITDGSLSLDTPEAQAAHLGPNGGRMQHFINSKGLKIMANYWPAIGDAPPRAVVHALHGHGAYLCFDMLKNNGPGKFCTYAGSWVEALNKAGYSVCGIDNQGAGRSEGLRCYADSFDAYVSDIVRHMDEAAALGTPAFAPDLPRFLLGGSLGGCLATMAALRKENRVAGIILLAPMLSLEKLAQRGINWLLRYIAPVVSTLVPTWAVVSTSRNTLYPDLQLVYDLDPNCWCDIIQPPSQYSHSGHGNTRARNGSEYVRTCAWLMAGGLELVTCPFLVFHGLKDDMCDLDGSRALYDRAKSTDKTLRLLDHMWHTLMKEPGNTGLLADVIEWLDKRAGPSDRPPNTSLVSELRVQAQASLAQASIPEPSVGKELSVDGAAHGGAVEVHATAA